LGESLRSCATRTERFAQLAVNVRCAIVVLAKLNQSINGGRCALSKTADRHDGR
jgi:hypothetical protein